MASWEFFWGSIDMVSCIKPFSFGICQSSWIHKSMANSIMIVFGASEFDEIGEGCSIWTNCDCVSYQKFVVKWPPWQHCNSLLQKCVGQSNDRFTFKFNFLPQKQTNYSKQNNSFFILRVYMRIEIRRSIFQIGVKNRF